MGFDMLVFGKTLLMIPLVIFITLKFKPGPISFWEIFLAYSNFQHNNFV